MSRRDRRRQRKWNRLRGRIPDNHIEMLKRFEAEPNFNGYVRAASDPPYYSESAREFLAQAAKRGLVTVLLLLALLPATAHGWAEPPGFQHLTSAQAAKKVNPAPETRPQNEENQAVPTLAQVQAWRSCCGTWNPNVPYVRGNYRGTTDEIIQWAARKWGFHPRVLRAVAVKESWWDMDQLGDFNNQTGEYDSYGLFQMKRPYTYTTPHIALPRDFSAFNADYYGSILRAYYDGDMEWLNDQERGKDYAAGDLWGSVGAWYAGRWWTPAATSYINNTKDIFWQRTWAQPGF